MGQRPPNTTQDYIEINKDSWNKRVAEHIKSDFYNHEAFLAGKTSLNEIELALFPDLRGKRVLHLQCHFGQDSISLARLGASVVGVDFSEQAIQNAEHFAKQTQADASFICCNIYDLEDHLEEKFDLIFTSYGTIGWLPDLNAWAKIIRNFLQPDGEFVFVEFHPALWMLDDNQDKIAYSYFNTEAITETNEGTYANKDAEIKLTSITWNHSIGEVFSALSQQGLQIQDLQEYDFSPYNIFFDGEEYEPQRYRIRSLANMLPLVYSLKARIQPGTQTSQTHKKGQA